MERKIADQNKLIEFLYDDLEVRHKELDDLKESLKVANSRCRRNLDIAEEAKMDLLALKEELKRKDEEKKNVCDKGCNKYNKSVDVIYEAGKKHRETLIDLKEISDSQKVKISCLRKHRDEIKANLDKLEEVHERKMKETSEEMRIGL